MTIDLSILYSGTSTGGSDAAVVTSDGTDRYGEKEGRYQRAGNDRDLVEKMVLRYLSIKDSENNSGGSNSYLLNLFA